MYIRSSQWDDIKSATNLSIMVKDLAEAIWGYKRCATFSLKGGRSPKSPEAELKPAAPAGDVQAILGMLSLTYPWCRLVDFDYILIHLYSISRSFPG